MNPPRRLPPLVSLVALAFAAGLLFAQPASARDVIASFTYTPKAPLSRTPVTFTSTSIATGGRNEVESQTWDLDGDGVFDGPSTPTASTSFPHPGSYLVRLRAVDTGGRTSEAGAIVKVGNRRPIASIAQFPEQAHTGDAVTFFSTSTDQDGSIQSQTWDLDGDGRFDDGKKTLASQVFAAAGVYTVRLRVTDDSGSSHDAAHTFAVTDLPGGQVSPLAARLLSPFPIVRMSGTVRRRGTRVRLLTVQAPANAQVQISCKGRGCPFERRARTVGAGKRTAGLLRFRQFRGRFLRPGVRVRVYVSARDAIGKYTRFRVRGGKPPARADRCLVPGGQRAMRCPAGT